MRPTSGYVWGCTLVALAACAGTADAAWNNVFQVCCNNCRSVPAPAPVVAGYANPCCPQPQTSCTTRYVQRSYYQPVTTYKATTVVEPVTTYRTSYYYEPVCSYRYSCYYDPCTCSYQQVATPVTSYRLRSRCCPVTSYLQRTCMTPVTQYQQSFYYEPVTTCCTTTTGAAVNSLPPGASVTPAPAPAAAETRDPGTAVPYPAAPAPNTAESRDPPPTSDSMKFDRNPRPAMPPATDTRGPGIRPVPAPTPPSLRPRADRIASRGAPNLEGTVVRPDRTPYAGARILLVNADRAGDRQVLTADRSGQFRASLASGGWLIYTHNASGRPVFSRRIEVKGGNSQQTTVVDR